MSFRRALVVGLLSLGVSSAGAAVVTIDPASFAGTYIVQGTVLTQGSGVRSADLAPGTYGVDIGPAGSCSRKFFVVNADGSVSNPPANDSSGAFIFDGSTVRFRNATLQVDPAAFQGLVHAQLSGAGGAPFQVAGPNTLTAVPDIVYRLRIERSSHFTHFLFDSAGNAQHPGALPAACSTAFSVPSTDALNVSGNTAQLRTTDIHFDPRSYAGRYSIGPLQNLGLVSGTNTAALVLGMEAQVKLSQLDALGFLSFRVRADGLVEHFAPPASGDSSNRIDLDNTAVPPAVRFRNATISFDPGLYAGAWRLDNQTPPASVNGIFGPLSVVVVPDMTYEMRVGSNLAPLNRISYRVNAAGQVSGAAIAGMVNGTQVFEAAGSTGRFYNTLISITPSDGSNWRVNEVTPSQATGITGSLRFHVVPTLLYQLADFSPAPTLTANFTVADPCGFTPNPVVVGATSYALRCVPTAAAGGDATVNEGALVQLDGTGSNFPGAVQNYAWTQVAGPAVVLANANTAAPTFVAPSVSGSQVLTFRLVVDDGVTFSDPDTVDVTVLNVNVAPIADAGDDQQVREGAPVQLSGTNSYDPDGTALTYAWTQTSGPPVALQPNASSANPSFVSPLGVTAVFTFELVVSDGQAASAADSVSVTTGPNHAPVADAGADQAVNENTSVQLDGTASSDPDSDAFTYAWAQVAGPAVTLSSATSDRPSFTAPSVGVGGADLIFRLVTTDAYAFNPLASAPAFVTVHVRNVADPPRCDLAEASIDKLWPPDHKMQEVTLIGVPSTATVAITAVMQDEPTNGLGDGDTSPDASPQGDRVLLRAERAGNRNGRVYTVSFTLTQQGLSCSGSVKVGVPKTRTGDAVDDGAAYDSTQP